MIAYSRHSKLGMIVCALLAAGCGGSAYTILPPNSGVALSPSDQLAVATREAVDAVNSEVGQNLLVVAKGQFASKVMYEAMSFGCGKFMIESREIRVAEKAECPPVIVIIHEAGHALGVVKHSADPTSIMYPIINRDMTVHDAAVSLVDELAKLNLL